MQVFVPIPHGMCAGVIRAIEILDCALKKYGAPVYMVHQIVHNKFVVDDFVTKGVVFVKTIEEVPDGANVVFSAHGSPQAVLDIAVKKNLNFVDAICPLVSKVHRLVKDSEMQGDAIAVIGHQSHIEVQGIIGQVTQDVVVLENADDIAKISIKDGQKLSVVSQTTVNMEDSKQITLALLQKFPDANLAGSSVCYATQNRQNAIRRILVENKIDFTIVVGSKESSNSNRLRDVAAMHNSQAILIDSFVELQSIDFANVAQICVTSGASVPEVLLDEVVEFFKKKYQAKVNLVLDTVENVKFFVPKSVRF